MSRLVTRHGVQTFNIRAHTNCGIHCSLCGRNLGLRANNSAGDIIRRLIPTRLRLGLDLDTLTQVTSRRDGSGGGIGRYDTVHFRWSVPGLGLARSSSGGRRRSKMRRLRLRLGLGLWRLLSFSEEVVASPLQYIPHMEAYHSS